MARGFRSRRYLARDPHLHQGGNQFLLQAQIKPLDCGSKPQSDSLGGRA